VAKSVKRGMWKLDEFYHHVTHTKHHHSTDEENTARRRTLSVPTRPRPASAQPTLPRHKSTWSASKHGKEDSSSSSSGSQTSLSILITPPPHQRTLSVEIAVQTDDIIEEDMSIHRKDMSLPEPPAAKGEPEQATMPMSPHVYIDQPVPDPFLVDEEGDAMSEEEKDTSPSSVGASPAHDVPLDLPEQSSIASPVPNINKEVPPPPVPVGDQDDEDEDEDAAPDLYVPALILPTMFLPIPNVRKALPFYFLTWWLCRHVLA
jgi:hypothetical protein